MRVPVLRLQDLTKHYGDVRAVENLNLEVYEGECFGFLGPNGAGKTTTIGMILGLLWPTAGTVEVLGQRVTPAHLAPLRPAAALVLAIAWPASLREWPGEILRTLVPSAAVVTLFAALVGTVFGFFTARGLVRRLQALIAAAEAWSRGDFSVTVHDTSRDEVGHLARRLNRMAEQLQNLLQARQELAALEERHRLARELHDAVKQQVFAAGMQLAVVRQGIRAFLETRDDIHVVAEAASGREAVHQAIRHAPDVVLMDLVMPGMDGVQATREIKRVSPRSQIIVLTSYHDDEHIFPAIRAGALSYLLKDVTPEELVDAVRRAARGEAVLHPRVAARLIQELHAERNQPERETPSAFADLTQRELEVLRLIAEGLSNAEIARRLVISERTVKSHVSNILSKLHLADRTQAAVFAWKQGLMRSEEDTDS